MTFSVDKQRNKVAGILERSRTLRKKCNIRTIQNTISEVKSFIDFCKLTKNEALQKQEFIVADFCEDESLTWALRIRSFFDVLPYKFSTISRHSRSALKMVKWQSQIPINVQGSFAYIENLIFFSKTKPNWLEPYSDKYSNLLQNNYYQQVKRSRFIICDFLEEYEKEGLSWVDQFRKISSNFLNLPHESYLIIAYSFSVHDILHRESEQYFSSKINFLVSYLNPRLKISDNTNIGNIILETTYEIVE